MNVVCRHRPITEPARDTLYLKMETCVMKTKIISFLFLVCFALTSAGYEEGLIGPGEYEGTVDWESGLLVVAGGGADRINIQKYAQIEVIYTTPFVAGYGGIWDLVLYGNSHLYYHGGQTEELTIRNNATANLYGGRIDAITSFQNVFWMYDEPTGQHINLYCQPGWSWLTDGAQNKVGITGLWMDNTPFTIQFQDRTSLGFDPVWANINVIIPEPLTLLFLAAGGILLPKRQRR